MRRTVFLAFLLTCFFVVSNDTTAQTLTKEQAVRLHRRAQAVGDNEHATLWREAGKPVIDTFSPNDSLVNTHFVLMFASKLWQGDVFQENLSKTYLTRIPKVTKQSFDEWKKAMVDVTGTDLPKLRDLAYDLSHKGFAPSPEASMAMYMLYQIIQQDRLFDQKGEFNNEQSKVLLSRLKTVPREAIVEWSNAIDPDGLGSLHEAAASIIEQDSLFVNGTLQRDALKQTLRALKAAKKK